MASPAHTKALGKERVTHWSHGEVQFPKKQIYSETGLRQEKTGECKNNDTVTFEKTYRLHRRDLNSEGSLILSKDTACYHEKPAHQGN